MDNLGNFRWDHRITGTLTKSDSRLEELISRCRFGNEIFMDSCWSWWFMVGKMWSLWLKPQKRSWIYSSPALFSKLLIRHCQIGGFKRKTCFLQNNYKSLAKATFELVALVTLRVPPVLTFALLNFIWPSRALRDGGVCSSMASTGGLGFPGGSLGWVRSRLVLVVYGRLLRPYLILVV